MEIKVKSAGIKKLTEKVQQRKNSLLDLSTFWDSVGMYMVKRTMRHFQQEQSPDGVKWKPLSTARIRQRNKRHKGGRMKILTDTGELRRSIAYKAYKSSVIFGSVLKYAAIQQFGGTITARRKGVYKHNYGPGKPKGGSYSYRWNIKIPARPYLGVTEDDRRKVLSMMKIYLKRNLM